MPSDTVKAFAQKFNVPEATVEKYWEVAKEEARKQGYAETDEDFYPYVVGIVRNMLKNSGKTPVTSETLVAEEKKKKIKKN